MKYPDALIPVVKTKMDKFFRDKALIPEISLEQSLADLTSRNYFSSVKDIEGKKYFLKIRLHDLDADKRMFEKQLIIGKVLKDNKLNLSKYTPQLIEGGLGEIDYLLYAYIEGINLGSRTDYAISKFKPQEMDQVIDILRSILEVPVDLLPCNFEKRGEEYYKKFLLYGTKKKELKLNLGIDWGLIEREARYFTHGDFKPNNFVRTKNGLMIVDFDQTAIGNTLTDVVRLWASILDPVEWKDKLLKEFLLKVHIKPDQKLLKDMLLIHTIFERNYLKFKFSRLENKYLSIREAEIKKVQKLEVGPFPS